METKTIKEIKKEFYLINALQKKAKLKCYSENIATYELKDNDTTHELCIINTEASFFRNEKIVDLLDLKNTSYISHRIFCNQTKEVLSSVFYRQEIIDESLN